MKCEAMQVQDALKLGLSLPYEYVRRISSVTLGPGTGREENLNTLLEARYFDETEEIRIFLQQGEWKAVCLSKEPEDNPIQEVYLLGNQKFGSQITVNRFLSADEDGQAYITATCLAGWKGEELHA